MTNSQTDTSTDNWSRLKLNHRELILGLQPPTCVYTEEYKKYFRLWDLWPIKLLLTHYSLLYSSKAALSFMKIDRITNFIEKYSSWIYRLQLEVAPFDPRK